MTRRIPAPVDTTIAPHRWWGGRIKDRWMQSNTAWVVSGLVLALALGGGIWNVLTPPGAPLPGTVTAGASATTAADAVPSDVMPSPVVSCTPQAPVEVLPEQLVLTSYITTWYPVGTMSAPGSPTGGPLQARRCFTRTPEGALYAVATWAAEQFTQNGTLGLSFSGYQWRSFTPDRAVLVIQMRRTTELETSQKPGLATASWVDNDWQVAPGVSDDTVGAAKDPLRVFTPWGSQ